MGGKEGAKLVPLTTLACAADDTLIAQVVCHVTVQSAHPRIIAWVTERAEGVQWAPGTLKLRLGFTDTRPKRAVAAASESNPTLTCYYYRVPRPDGSSLFEARDSEPFICA